MTKTSRIVCAVVLLTACGGQDIASSQTEPEQAAEHGQNLCSKLGGAPNVAAFIGELAGQEVSNPDIMPFFAVTGTTGHPTVPRVVACLTELLQDHFGCPGIHYRGNGNPNQCRDMSLIHSQSNLGKVIPQGPFDTFVNIALTLATRKGVDAATRAEIANVLESFNGEVVQSSHGRGR
jgi:hypothetical protein